ncbi:redoxin domain-containing protein [Pseudoxanthomonas mexicana]|uniref:Redoxin domain-containing protein n=1 Tax=Pseudoxanthomonas mexicana TaxID=128785 RepID=A0A7G9THG1_PSEMX|nr:redoxin domain-containing protein [Pseudoxanthomonas mexicana]QNN79536.1 redoxin domain-containing protein [Pseudoxanthomonas mexicana]
MNAMDRPAPPWQVDRWFNTSRALSLEALRGKVIVLEAFQMLCPGCVSHGLPQASRVHATFSAEQVAVVGLHAVFEHHAAMTPVALEAFLHEYRIVFPVGVDRPGTRGPIPQTMEAYAMRGTPTLVLIDAQGRLRHRHFGQVSDLVLGAQIAVLAGEAKSIATAAGAKTSHARGCDAQDCLTFA